MRVKDIKKQIGKLLILILVRALYLLITNTMLDDLWYTGYGSYGVDLNINKEVVGFFVFVAMALYFLTLKETGVFVDIFMHLLFILYYVPLSCVYSLNDAKESFFVYSSIYVFLIIFFVKKFMKKHRSNKGISKILIGEKKTLFGNDLLNLFCVVVCCFCIIYKISYNGFSFSLSLSHDDIYSNRNEFQQSMDGMSGNLIAYIFSFFYNLASYIAPVFLLHSLINKKFFFSIVSLITVISIFSMSSGKGDVFFLVIIVGLFFVFKFGWIDKFKNLFIGGMIGLLALCILEWAFLGHSEIYMLLIRRVMYLPAWLNKLYFDFFELNPKVLWTQNVFLLQKILVPVYDVPPLSLISETYFMGLIPSPNTGLFAEAYMHFGTIGVLIYPILTAVLLKFVSYVYSRYDKYISIAVSIKLILQITNVSIVRTDFILSFVLFTLIMWIFPKFSLKNDVHTRRKNNGK